MVNDERIRRIYYFAVHLNSAFFLVYGIPDTTSSIKGASTLAGIPFVFAQALVIVRIYYSVLTLGKRYPAKGLAIVDTAVRNHKNH